MDTAGKNNLYKNLKLLFRCDAGSNSDIGTGHVIRTIRLAEELIYKGILKEKQIIIMYRHEKAYNLAKNLIASSEYNFKKIEFKRTSLAEEKKIILNTKSKIIIFDLLRTSKTLLMSLKKSKKILFGFDEIGNSPHLFDYLVYSLVRPKNNKINYFEGLKYLNLSKNIKKKKYIKKNVSSIIVCLGGNDKRDFFSLLLNVAKNYSNKITFHFMLSEMNFVRFLKKNKKKIFLSKNIKIYNNSKSYYEIAQKSDLGIISGGITLFEFSSSGIPSIAIPQHKHQIENITNLEKKNITRSLKKGMTVNTEDIIKNIDYLIKNYELRIKMHKKGKTTIDGRGLERITNIIKNILDLNL